MNFFKLNKNDLFVISQLAHKDKSRENSSNFLGQIWQILDPFINTFVLVMVFGVMFKNKRFVNYPVYVATGIMFYNLFSTGTKNCLNALSGNKNFLIKAQLDKTIYVKEKVFVALINFGYSFLIYLGVMIAYRVPFRITMLLVIPDVLLLISLVYGFGKILSIVNALFADITYFHEIFLLFIFYGSALFFDPSRVAPVLQFLLSLNPIYLSIAIARISIIDGIVPPYTLWIKLLLYSATFYWIGNIVFEKGSENIVAKL